MNLTQSITLLSCGALFLSVSCEDYLSVKPNKKIAEPTSLTDCEALLDNSTEMNLRFPAVNEAASDNHFLSQTNWEALTVVEDRLNYHWDPGYTAVLSQWQQTYKTVMLANQVLEILETINRSVDPLRYDHVKGTALFFRAYAFYFLAQAFAPAYEAASAVSRLGIPLRLTADIGIPSSRATVEETYSRIESDLRMSVSLLPEQTIAKTRPSKVAAHAMLARALLTMGRYGDAAEAAEQALALNDLLLDYNTLDATASIPFPQFNTEVIFHAGTGGNSVLNPNRARIDTLLYGQYGAHDLRKNLFFSTHSDGYQIFKGKYDGLSNASPFSGIATDEVYFIRAEALARTNHIPEAMTLLNRLLETRWETGHFTPYTAQDEDEALGTILAERRKQLLYRNLRWGDLKRLNTEPRFAKTLVRLLNGQRYELPPNDPRYTLLIPREVIENSTITQNTR